MIVVLAVNAFCRVLLLICNPSMFDVSFVQAVNYFFAGMRFDISAIAYANMLYIVLYFIPFPIVHSKIYKKILFFIWFIPNIVILAANITDAFYYPYVFRRATYDIFGVIFTMQSEIKNLWFNFIIDFWQAYLIFIICIGLYIYVYNKIINRETIAYKIKKDYIFGALTFIVMCILTIISARGGIQYKPLSLVNASKYKHPSLVVNSAFSIIRSYGKKGLEKKNFFDVQDEMYNYFNTCKDYTGREFQKKNIVIIILESFSNEHLNSLNHDFVIEQNKHFAPFLDSLIYEGYFCRYAFANGKRSIEGIPAIVSSIPTLKNIPFLLSSYINNDFTSLPQLLSPFGYISYFFHGGVNGTMNFDAYSKAAGFTKYFGKNEYPNKNDYDGKWGIWDKPYLLYVADILNETPEPFFSCIFTLSSHHPYRVPEEYENILPDGPLQIHKPIAYTDMALKNFFLRISETDWYYNTIFVITSDHTSEPYLWSYKQSAGRYSIPLLFYAPGTDLKGFSSKVCQHTDIMPSILDYLGYQEKFTAFGNSIFDSNYHGMNITYSNEFYQLLIDSLAVIFTNDIPVKMWNFNSDPAGNDNYINNTEYKRKLKEITLLYKSYIQQYNNNLIENKHTCLSEK